MDSETTGKTKEYYILTESAAAAMDEFDSMVTSTANTPNISTGFHELDNHLDGGLYPGLIILGAVTSVGKTAICLQIFDQIAKGGHDVLIFSLEMSKFELMARSFSRESFLNDSENALTVREFLDGKKLKAISNNEGKFSNYLESKKNYTDYAERIFIHEPKEKINTDYIRKQIEKHAEYTDTPPVVLIDYIQLLAPDDPRMSDKQAIDSNITALKHISVKYSIPVVGISSLNRASYSNRNNGNGSSNGNGSGNNSSVNKVCLESFKESGAIEYSADVLFGLNRISNDEMHNKAEMELEILKNRNGRKDVSAKFDYYYKFNCFTEQRRPMFTTKGKTV